MSASPQRLPYKKIFVVHVRPSSRCEFFEVKEDPKEGGYYAYCRVLGRFLTSYAIVKCERYWEKCPYRRIGLQIESPS